MFKYCYTVRYSEVDNGRKLTIPALVNYLQDICVLHSERVGAGLDYVEETGRVWMLRAWRIEILDDMYYNESLHFHTWPYKFKGVSGYRNLMVKKYLGGNRDEVCVRADSEWMLYSVKDNTLVRAEEDDTKFYPCEDGLDMEKCKRRLTTHNPLTKTDKIVVEKYMTDTNGHVNNAKYIQLALEVVPFDEKIAVLEAEYKKQAMPGDIIVPYYYKDEKEAFVSLRDTKDTIYANVKFTFAVTVEETDSDLEQD